MFSVNFCEIFKNTFFTEHLRVNASVFHFILELARQTTFDQ